MSEYETASLEALRAIAEELRKLRAAFGAAHFGAICEVSPLALEALTALSLPLPQEIAGRAGDEPR